MKRAITILLAISALFLSQTFAQTATATKKTVILGQSTADGSSKITEKALEECIISLPSPKDLAADVKAGSEYLKEINGDKSKEGHTKVYTASVTVSYKVRQKFLLIITTSSIEGQEPTVREEERVVMAEKVFHSDPGEGDIFAGRSNRKYYYSTSEAAGGNAKARAEAWIKQQQNVLCAAGGGK